MLRNMLSGVQHLMNVFIFSVIDKENCCTIYFIINFLIKNDIMGVVKGESEE